MSDWTHAALGLVLIAAYLWPLVMVGVTMGRVRDMQEEVNGLFDEMKQRARRKLEARMRLAELTEETELTSLFEEVRINGT